MKKSKISFSTTLLTAGKTATGIQVPDEIIERLGAGKKPPVKVTINGYTYRSTVAVMGGVFMIGVSADVREKSGVKGGDTVNIELEPDTEKRVVEVPEALEAAFKKNAGARAFFETLSNSGKQRYTLPVAQAKTDETRNRRVDKAIEDLENHRK